MNAQLKTIRYYSYYEPAFAIAKTLLRDSGYYNAAGTFVTLNAHEQTQLSKAIDLKDLHTITRQDFYMIQPCPSHAKPGVVMEGTRLTLVAHQPEGYEFTIRTPGTPGRWRQYDDELNHVFQRLTDAIAVVGVPSSEDSVGCDEPPVASTEITPDETAVLKLALELFFYWVTFAPLSRGTACCGYIALASTLLSCNLFFAKPLPKDKQLDWEAIFAPDVGAFVAKVLPWLPMKRYFVPCGGDWDVAEVVPTLRSMIEILSQARGSYLELLLSERGEGAEIK